MPKETISQKLKNFGHRFKDLPNHIRKSKIVTSKNYSSEVLETISAVDIKMESILHTNGKIESKAIPETNTDVILNPDNPDYARAVRFNNANDYLQRELRVIQEAIEMLNQFPDIPDDVNGIPAPEEYGLADRLSVLIDNIAPSTQSRLATTRSGWEFPESVIDTQLFKTHLSRPSYSNSSISGFHRSCKRFSFNGPFPTTDNDDILENEIKFRKCAYNIYKAINNQEEQLNTSLRTIAIENVESLTLKTDRLPENTLLNDFSGTVTDLSPLSEVV